MRAFACRIAIALFTIGFCPALPGRELRSAIELNSVIFGDETNTVPFCLEATATETIPPDTRKSRSFMDETGAVQLYLSIANSNLTIQAGDRLELSGITSPKLSLSGSALAYKVRRIAHGPPPSPIPIKGYEFFSGRHINRLVRLTGLVRNVFMDEIDPNITIVELHSDGETIPIPLLTDSTRKETIQRLIGAKVSVVGTVSPRGVSSRVHAGGVLSTHDDGSRFKIITPPPDDPFNAPDISPLFRMRPSDVANCGWHTAKGCVLCVWNNTHILLRTNDGKTLRANLDTPALPMVGANIAVCGIPEVDLFYITLNLSKWKRLDDSKATELSVAVQTTDLLTDKSGIRKIRPGFYGKLIRLRGIVSTLGPDVENGPGFILECDRQTVGVIFGNACQGLSAPPVGTTVEVSGICLVRSESWAPSRHFPRLTGVDVVLRTPEDLTVVAHPPWWTTARLLYALGTLSILIILVLIWNASLRVLVARRSRQLVREQAEKLGAEFRVEERTRLAAELHDSVAQNLSSVSMQLDAVQMAAHDLAEPFREALGLASKTLLSCRQELRNCLWDLRSQALDEPDLGNAVQKALKPHLNGAALRIRFNVSRRLVSDQTAHAVLRILRELAANSLRHGHARNLTIAGCLDGRLLKFSLADDGAGFDPVHAAGVERGHFGLSGIHDRVNKMHGTFEISSEPGRGTKAVVTLNAQ